MFAVNMFVQKLCYSERKYKGSGKKHYPFTILDISSKNIS